MLWTMHQDFVGISSAVDIIEPQTEKQNTGRDPSGSGAAILVEVDNTFCYFCFVSAVVCLQLSGFGRGSEQGWRLRRLSCLCPFAFNLIYSKDYTILIYFPQLYKLTQHSHTFPTSSSRTSSSSNASLHGHLDLPLSFFTSSVRQGCLSVFRIVLLLIILLIVLLISLHCATMLTN